MSNITFKRLRTATDLLYFLRNCTAIDGGGPLDLDELNFGGTGSIAHLIARIKSGHKLGFGHDEETGNGVLRTAESHGLLRVRGFQLVETYRLVHKNDGNEQTDVPEGLLRTVSVDGKEGETPEQTLCRGFRQQGGFEINPGRVFPISHTPCGSGLTPERHRSTTYKGLWRESLISRYIVTHDERPPRWKDRLYIKQPDLPVEIFGTWQPASDHNVWGRGTPSLWSEALRVGGYDMRVWT